MCTRNKLTWYTSEREISYLDKSRNVYRVIKLIRKLWYWWNCLMCEYEKITWDVVLRKLWKIYTYYALFSSMFCGYKAECVRIRTKYFLRTAKCDKEAFLEIAETCVRARAWHFLKHKRIVKKAPVREKAGKTHSARNVYADIIYMDIYIPIYIYI